MCLEICRDNSLRNIIDILLGSIVMIREYVATEVTTHAGQNNHSLTLGAHAQEGYCSLVGVFVKSHLTFGASICPENTVTYSAGKKFL